MTAICAWCRVHMGEKAPLTDTATTHSICLDCIAKVLAEVLAEADMKGR